MSIRLDPKGGFEDLRRHIGHKIVCVMYGDDAENVSLECEDCYEVLISFDNPESKE